MARALDHFVIGVPDLDTAGAQFSALGFMVGAKNLHPWGTQNRIVQFGDESFFELITVADPAAIPPHAPSQFSFGAFVRDALARAPGLSMLVLKSDDAKADAAEFTRLGIGDFAPFHFARKGKRPDGSETEVAFTLAFAADPSMPECGFFTCQQHFPQNFWAKPAQAHANGATGIARVTIVADNPTDQHIFLGEFVGERALRSSSFGIEIEAGKNASGTGGVIEIISKEGFAFRYGEAAPEAKTPQFAGIEIVLDGLDAIDKAAANAGIPLLTYAGGRVLPRSAECATTLRFIATRGAAR